VPDCKAQKIPVFSYFGAPQLAQRTAETVAPGAAPVIIPKIIPQQGSEPVDSYHEGSEKPENWVFAINMTSTTGCTGTLIGPQVLLTAAHCVQRIRVFDISAGEQVVGSEAPSEILIRTTCEAHPRFRPFGPLSRLDFALCHLDRPFPLTVEVPNRDQSLGTETSSQVVKFQRLSTSFRDVGRHQKLFVAGFGCSSFTATKIDGRIRAGLATLSGLSEVSIILGGYGRRDSAILCAGDSGGAAYRLASTDQPYGPRVVVGVNSANILFQGQSFIARTSSPAFRWFLEHWRARWKTPAICGIDKEIEPRCAS
jgi:hypothetical protein